MIKSELSNCRGQHRANEAFGNRSLVIIQIARRKKTRGREGGKGGESLEVAGQQKLTRREPIMTTPSQEMERWLWLQMADRGGTGSHLGAPASIEPAVIGWQDGVAETLEIRFVWR